MPGGAGLKQPGEILAAEVGRVERRQDERGGVSAAVVLDALGAGAWVRVAVMAGGFGDAVQPGVVLEPAL